MARKLVDIPSHFYSTPIDQFLKNRREKVRRKEEKMSTPIKPNDPCTKDEHVKVKPSKVLDAQPSNGAF